MRKKRAPNRNFFAGVSAAARCWTVFISQGQHVGPHFYRGAAATALHARNGPRRPDPAVQRSAKGDVLQEILIQLLLPVRGKAPAPAVSLSDGQVLLRSQSGAQPTRSLCVRVLRAPTCRSSPSRGRGEVSFFYRESLCCPSEIARGEEEEEETEEEEKEKEESGFEGRTRAWV